MSDPINKINKVTSVNSNLNNNLKSQEKLQKEDELLKNKLNIDSKDFDHSIDISSLSKDILDYIDILEKETELINLNKIVLTKFEEENKVTDILLNEIIEDLESLESFVVNDLINEELNIDNLPDEEKLKIIQQESLRIQDQLKSLKADLSRLVRNQIEKDKKLLLLTRNVDNKSKFLEEIKEFSKENHINVDKDFYFNLSVKDRLLENLKIELYILKDLEKLLKVDINETDLELKYQLKEDLEKILQVLSKLNTEVLDNKLENKLLLKSLLSKEKVIMDNKIVGSLIKSENQEENPYLSQLSVQELALLDELKFKSQLKEKILVKRYEERLEEEKLNQARQDLNPSFFQKLKKEFEKSNGKIVLIIISLIMILILVKYFTK